MKERMGIYRKKVKQYNKNASIPRSVDINNKKTTYKIKIIQGGIHNEKNMERKKREKPKT